MGWVVLGVLVVIVVIVVVWWVVTPGPSSEADASAGALDQEAPIAATVEDTDETADDGDAGLMDLRGLPSMTLRIRGSAYWVSDAGRETYSGREYVLKREPRNKHDRNAVAVYGKGRKVGYVPAGRAGMIAPVLDQIGAAGYIVNGSGVMGNSIVLHVDVPKVPDLRRLAAGRPAVDP